MEDDDELALLVGTLVKSAQSLLKNQRGEFFPFAAFINVSGIAEMLGADLGVAPAEVIDFLRGALRAMAEQRKIKASGICVNVAARLPGHGDKVDAICCTIERLSQQPIDFYVPFHKGLLGRLVYGKPIVLPGKSLVFPPASDVA